LSNFSNNIEFCILKLIISLLNKNLINKLEKLLSFALSIERKII